MGKLPAGGTQRPNKRWAKLDLPRRSTDVSSPRLQKSAFFFSEIVLYSRVSRLMQRAYASSRYVGVGCDGRRWLRQASVVVTDGEVVWSRPPDAEVKPAADAHASARVMGARKPGPQGEHEGHRNTIAQGGPDRSGWTCGTCRLHFLSRRATGLSRGPALPAPLILERRTTNACLGHDTPRDRACTPQAIASGCLTIE